MANRSLNQVQLIGNLTRDPDLRYTPNGTAVCTFGVATNRQWVTESGERKEDVEFHRVVSWQKLAEICGKFLSKGRKVYVQGRLQTRSWKGQDGNERQTTEVVIDDMIILDPSGRRDDGSTPYIKEPMVKKSEKPKSKPAEKKVKKETEPKKEPVEQQSEEIPPDDIPF
jgi:single-strand DNA-binding protein